MPYQVLARKWRPQRFDDVIGQRGVTQTLRNAIAAGRIAQSFVFAGPRGVGKTTTARILARALNCEQGPTADPCGVCEACVEIAEGRDIDVFEIDAATHTQVDKVRDIIVSGLGVAPVRDRYKIFIVDEVHRFSPQSFDALLKSIEEPPPHVVFMMATTEIEKVPATIQSRSQVFELKTIGVAAIADQLRRIADAERIAVDAAALMLIARAGDGSMRDAQSAFDQVIAFAGGRITADDVATVLGLVRRDLLIEIASAVAAEDAPAVFELAGRAVESGYDLRLVVRELARVCRDLLVLGVDPSRAADPEIAADAERAALLDLARRFSREDLMRAFDVLSRAEHEIRGSAQPRYHLEMALLRWIHLRRLVPITELIQTLATEHTEGHGSRSATEHAEGHGSPAGRGLRSATEHTEGRGLRSATEHTDGRGLRSATEHTEGHGSRSATEHTEGRGLRSATEHTEAHGSRAAAEHTEGRGLRSATEHTEGHGSRSATEHTEGHGSRSATEHTDGRGLRSATEHTDGRGLRSATEHTEAHGSRAAAEHTEGHGSPRGSRGGTVKAVEARLESAPGLQPVPAADFKDAFLSEIRRAKKFFHGTVVAQAQRIDVAPGRVLFTFAPAHRALRAQLEQSRGWLETVASQLAGRPTAVAAAEQAVAPAASPAEGRGAHPPAAQDRQTALKQQALNDTGVQAMLDVFATEIRDVEEM